MIALRLRVLAQEGVYEVCADRFIRMAIARDLLLFNPFKISWEQLSLALTGLHHSVDSDGKEERKPVGDPIDGLHELRQLGESLGVLLFSRPRQVAAGFLGTKIAELEGQIQAIESQIGLLWRF